MMSADAATASRRVSVVISTATARSLPLSSDRNTPGLRNCDARIAGLGLDFLVVRALRFGLDPPNLVLRADEPELADHGGPLGQQPGGTRRPRVLTVALDQRAQLVCGRLVELLSADELSVEPK